MLSRAIISTDTKHSLPCPAFHREADTDDYCFRHHGKRQLVLAETAGLKPDGDFENPGAGSFQPGGGGDVIGKTVPDDRYLGGKRCGFYIEALKSAGHVPDCHVVQDRSVCIPAVPY